MPENIQIVNATKCLICSRTDSGRWYRGICTACAQQVRGRIQRGLTTLAELESLGMLAAVKSGGGRGKVSALDKLLAERRAACTPTAGAAKTDNNHVVDLPVGVVFKPQHDDILSVSIDGD